MRQQWWLISGLLAVSLLGTAQPSGTLLQHIRSGRWDQALAQVEAGLANQPTGWQHIDLLARRVELLDWLRRDSQAVVATAQLARAFESFEAPHGEVSGPFLHAIAVIAEQYIRQAEWSAARQCIRLGRLTALNDSTLAHQFSSYWIYLDAVVIQGTTGNIPRAVGGYLQAFGSWSASSDPIRWAFLARRLGNMHRVMGDFDAARQFYTRQFEVYDQFSDPLHPEISLAHYHIGSVYYEMAEYERALEHYLQAEESWMKYGATKPGYLRYLLEATGDMYWQLDQSESALAYYDRALLYTPVLNKDRAAALVEEGSSLQAAGNPNAALPYFREALAFREQVFGPTHPLTGACQTYLAEALRESGASQTALSTYNQAIDRLLPHPMTSEDWLNQLPLHSGPYLLEAFAGKTALLWKQYQQTQKAQLLEAADSASRSTIDVLEELCQRPIGFAARRFWRKQVQSIVTIAVEIALEHHRLDSHADHLSKAFELAQQGIAWELVAAARQNSAAHFSGVPPEFLARERELEAALFEYQEKVRREEQRCESSRPPQLEVWSHQLDALQLAYRQLMQEIETVAPKYYHFKFAPPRTSIELLRQQFLTDGKTALLRWYESDDTYYFFCLTKTRLRYHRLPKSPEFSTAINRFSHLCADPAFFTTNSKQAYAEYSRAAYDLFQVLMGPFTTDLAPPIDRLIFFGNGRFATFPWSALLTQPAPAEVNYRKLEYLAKHYALRSMTSTRSLTPPPPSANGLLTVGLAPKVDPELLDSLRLQPLRYNYTEVVQGLAHFPSRLVTGSAATETFLKEQAAHYRLLHLATHAVVDDRRIPTVLLAASGKDDGFLFVDEVYGLPLSCDLLVLSACHGTASPDSTSGDLRHLVRAFHYAGARSVLASNWSVDDRAAALIMQRFYELLKEGVAKDRALQRALQHYLEKASPEHTTPYYWANWHFYGNAAPLSFSGRRYLAMAGLLLGIVLVGLVYWKSSYHPRSSLASFER